MLTANIILIPVSLLKAPLHGRGQGRPLQLTDDAANARDGRHLGSHQSRRIKKETAKLTCDKYVTHSNHVFFYSLINSLCKTNKYFSTNASTSRYKLDRGPNKCTNTGIFKLVPLLNIFNPEEGTPTPPRVERRASTTNNPPQVKMISRNTRKVKLARKTQRTRLIVKTIPDIPGNCPSTSRIAPGFFRKSRLSTTSRGSRGSPRRDVPTHTSVSQRHIGKQLSVLLQMCQND